VLRVFIILLLLDHLY